MTFRAGLGVFGQTALFRSYSGKAVYIIEEVLHDNKNKGNGK